MARANKIIKLDQPPRDKSITHRAMLLAAISSGTSTISHPLLAGDTLSTLAALEALGVKCSLSTNNELKIIGKPMAFKHFAINSIHCHNSGTTIRHLVALLANAEKTISLHGDHSLNARPMERITLPLKNMGANISATDGHAPIVISPTSNFFLKDYCLPLPSAQIKSAFLFCALLNQQAITLTGKIASRDHTEKLFQWLKLPINILRDQINFSPIAHCDAFELLIPADPSSTLYYIFLFDQLYQPGDELHLPHHYFNPTRCHSWELLQQAGFDLQWQPCRTDQPEQMGTLKFTKTANAKTGIVLKKENVPNCIDEIPLLIIWSLFLNESSFFEGLAELRKKESDRLLEVEKLARCWGAENYIQVREDAVKVQPLQTLDEKANPYSGHDHRICMIHSALSTIKYRKPPVDSPTISISNPQWAHDCNLILVNLKA